MSDDIHELIAAYSLDAVDPAEAAAVEQAIADDDALRAELDAYRATIAAVVEHTEPAPSTPSPTVWANIENELKGVEPVQAPKMATVTDIRSSKRWSRLGTVISVAAVAASLVLGLRVVDLQSRLDDTASIEDVVNAAMTDPDATIVDLAGQEGFETASARIVVDEAGVGYIVSHTLEALDDEHTYQLWAIVADGGSQRIISAGVLGPDPGVSQFQTQAEIVGFAITAEVAGGVAVSDQPAVAAWLADA